MLKMYEALLAMEGMFRQSMTPPRNHCSSMFPNVPAVEKANNVARMFCSVEVAL